jgi:hypothetical protein
MGIGTTLRKLVTAHGLAQAGIILELAVTARTLAEIYRLHFEQGTAFTLDAALPWIGGALIALGFTTVSILLFFVGRNRQVAVTALAMIPILIAYKTLAIGPD